MIWSVDYDIDVWADDFDFSLEGFCERGNHGKNRRA
jgi:hypothetical protein